MKKVIIVLASMMVVVFLAFWCWVYVVDIQWCVWVNRIRIVGQPGSTVHDVRQKLGIPFKIIQPQSVSRGFTPVPKVPTTTSECYVYKRIFMGAGWYWVAYVFLDKSGNVTGVHIANS